MNKPNPTTHLHPHLHALMLTVQMAQSPFPANMENVWRASTSCPPSRRRFSDFQSPKTPCIPESLSHLFKCAQTPFALPFVTFWGPITSFTHRSYGSHHHVSALNQSRLCAVAVTVPTRVCSHTCWGAPPPYKCNPRSSCALLPSLVTISKHTEREREREMDRRGGCCIARYGGGGGVYDTSKVDRIMLRFRPIAPKPVGGSVSGGSTPEISEKCKKGKRRYVRDERCNNKKRKGGFPPEEKKGCVAGAVTTLSLLPESPEPRDSPEERGSDTWLNFESFPSTGQEYMVVNMPAARPVRVVGSSVTVDCVTDTWVEGGGLGFTDEERRMSLERDTCPGFLSDGYGRVVWMNGAYRSMVGQENETDEVTVCLVVKETASVAAAALAYSAFTCRVRVQYTCGSLTLPCDVWRMEGGGFAWRLDVKAALCLGRP